MKQQIIKKRGMLLSFIIPFLTIFLCFYISKYSPFQTTSLKLFYIIMYSLSSVFFYTYINYHNHYRKSEIISGNQYIALAISCLYPISAFTVSHGTDTSIITIAAIFPLLILGMEKIHNQNTPTVYAVVLIISILSNPNYILIPIIISFIYMLTLDYRNLKHFSVTFFYKFLSDAIAVGVSAFFISQFYDNSISIRFPNYSFSHNTYDAFYNMISEHIYFSASLIFIITICIWDLFISFYIDSKEKWHELKYCFLFILSFLSYYVSTSSYLMSGLNHSASEKQHHMFIFVFLSLLLFNHILEKFSSYNFRVPLICGLFSIILVIFFMIKRTSNGSISSYVRTIEFLILLMIIAIIICYSHNKKPLLITVFTGLILCEGLFIYISAFLSNAKQFPNYTDSAVYAINSIKSDILAAAPGSQIIIYDNNSSGNPVSYALSGVDYIISYDDAYIPDSNLIELPEYETTSPTGAFNTIHVYQNPNAVKGAIIIPKDLSDIRLDSDYPFTTCNKFAAALGCPDIFILSDDNISVRPNKYKKTDRNSATLVYSFNEPGDYYTNFVNTYHIGELNSSDEFEYNVQMSFEDCNQNIIKRESARLNISALADFFSYLDSNTIPVTYEGNIPKIDLSSAAGNYVLISDKYFTNLNVDKGRFINLYNNKFLLIDPEMYENPEITLGSEKTISYTAIFVTIISLILLVLIVLFNKSLTNFIRSYNYHSFTKKVYLFVADNKVYFYVLLISSALLTAFMFIHGCVPFGGNSFVVSDGYIEDYPTTTHLINNLRSLNFYRNDYTLGYMSTGISIWSFLYFLNPFRLILLLFPSNQSLLGFNSLYMLEFILCGPSILYYLTHRPYGKTMDKHELKLIPIALAYNLSSYVLCYLSFNGFIDLAMFLPLIMLSMDNLVHKKKYMMYIILLSIYMILNVYYAFLLCEFLLLYFFAMDHGRFKTFIKNGLRFACASVFAAGIASFTLIPFYFSVMNTNYSTVDKAGQSSIPVFSQTLIGSLRDIEVFHRISLVTPDSTIANTYCGLLLFLAVPMFLCIKKIRLSYKLRMIILVFVLYFSYGNELMNFILHGFHFQSFVPNRFSLFMIFMIINIFYDVINHFEDIFQNKTVIAFALFSLLICIGVLYNNPHLSTISSKITLLFTITYISIVLIGHKSSKYYTFTRLLLAALSVELLLSSMYSGIEVFGYDEKNQSDMRIMRELSTKYHLKDNRLARTEICNMNLPNASCLTDTYSGSVFTSTLQYEQYNLAKTWGIDVQSNIIRYSQGNPLANIMLNEKYFFVDVSSEYTIPSYFRELDQISNIKLFEDPYVSNWGTFIGESESDIFSGNNSTFDKQNCISKALSAQNLYDIITDSDYSTDIIGKNELSIRLELPSNITGDIYCNYNTTIIYMGYANAGVDNHLYKSISLSNEEIASTEITFAVLNIDTLQKISNSLNKYNVTVNSIEARSINFSINTKEDGLLYIPLPESTNWTINTNNNSVISHSFNSGNIISIKKGADNITLDYVSSSSTPVYIISIIFIIVLTSYHLYQKNKEKM